MKMKTLLIGALLSVVGIVGCQADGGDRTSGAYIIDQLNMGLGPDAVFNDPIPATFAFPTTEAGESELIPTSFSTAPPTVPHSFEEFLPITMYNNQCLECHDRPRLMGREHVKGKKLAMPQSHYGGFGGRGDKDIPSGSHFMCSKCHAPVSDALPLVENTF